MISSTAAAKPVPCASENSEAVLRGGRFGRGRGARPAGKGERHDHQVSEGAATIPIATADWPLSTPTATSTAKDVRKTDSERISAVNRPKRRLPARKPRAK